MNDSTTNTTSTTNEDDDGRFPVKVRKFQRNMKVVLTDKQKLERGDRAAYLKGEIEQREEEMASAKKQAQARIDELDSEFSRLMLELRDGSIFTDVACEERFIYRTGEVVEVRTDTKPEQEIGRRAMTDRERQPELPLGEGRKAAEADEPDDEETPEEAAAIRPSLAGAATTGSTKVVGDEDAGDEGIVDDDYDPNACDVDEEPDTSILDAKDTRDTDAPPKLETEKPKRGTRKKAASKPKKGGGK